MTGMLFSFDPLGNTARARVWDEPTSHAAASRMNRSGKAGRHAMKVLDAVMAHPNSTAAELGEITGLGHIETQRRLSDLLKEGVVAKAAPRQCGVKGSRMVTWRVAE